MRKTNLAVVSLLLVLFAGPARAGLIWDQQPQPTGGPAADTSFYYFGDQIYALLAEDVQFASHTEVRRMVWWGFYGGDEGFSDSTNPPTGDERMRVRFYGARPGDGLPGIVVYENTFSNPARTDTGRFVATGRPTHEYMFQIDLPSAITLAANTTYWLEIVQDGDVNSHYRWEASPDNQTEPFAFNNSWVSDWQSYGSPASLAFQLWDTPEPSSALFLLTGCAILFCCRAAKRHWVSRLLLSTGRVLNGGEVRICVKKHDNVPGSRFVRFPFYEGEAS